MSEIARKHTVVAAYWLGEIVYLRVNEDRRPGMITRVSVNAGGLVTYFVGWRGGTETAHYECELSSEYVPDFGTCETVTEQSR